MAAERIDVRAVMDAAATGMEGAVRERRGHRDRLFEARDAVAELIEAAREVDKGMCGMSVKETRLLVRLHKALARMGESA